MPWFSAAFGGFGVYILDSVVFKRAGISKLRLGSGALVGFALGAWCSYQTQTTIARIQQEKDIINAFDTKYMNTVLNATGYGSNYLSTRDYSNTQSFKKPY